MLQFRARVDLGVMAMKGCFAFLKAPASQETHHQICLVSYTGHSLGAESYPSAEVQSMYSTAPADWAIQTKDIVSNMSPVCATKQNL